MNPIIMVANFSGNVGKTTLTRNLLVPNIEGVKVFAVEDVNAGYNQGEAVTLSAEQTQSILEQVIEQSFKSPVIVDVGASNVFNFFQALAGYENMAEFITRVVVPTEASEKVQVDTYKTLEYLVNDLGFDESRISLIFNKVSRKAPVEVFNELSDKAAGLGVFVAGSVPESSTFQTAGQLATTVYELAARNPEQVLADSKATAAAGGDSRDGVRLVLAIASARKLKTTLDALFETLDIELG